MNNEEQLVSIIIPMFERYNLLNDLWDCLQKQTHTNFEVIIVDDGSYKPITLPSFLDHRFSLIRYNDNKGPGYARKIGRENAKGDYICYLDSDDWWSPDYLAELVKDLNNNSNVGMVYSNTTILSSGSSIGDRVLEYSEAPSQIMPTIISFKKRFWSTSSCMWRKDVSLADSWISLRNHEDYIHDLLSSMYNNKVFFSQKAITFKNQTAEDRIVRDKNEVKKALLYIVGISNIDDYTNLSYFILWRLYEFRITLSWREYLHFCKIGYFEFKFLNFNFYKYITILFLISLLNVHSYAIKVNIKKLNKIIC